jgi:hypothetical protein
MRFRHTEDWSADGYESLVPVRTGEAHSTQWVMPIEVSASAIIRETLLHVYAVSVVCGACLFLAAALGLGRNGLWALSVPFVICALCAIWKCAYIPRRERIVAYREGNAVVVTRTSGTQRAIRLDVSAFRYAWLERQLRGGPIGWMIRFGSTPDEGEAGLDLRLLGIHTDQKQRFIYAALLHQYIAGAFEHIEALAETREHNLIDPSNFSKRARRDDRKLTPVSQSSVHPLSKS